MEREIINADVLFIGAGPACLAGAIQLMNLLEDQQEKDNLSKCQNYRPGKGFGGWLSRDIWGCTRSASIDRAHF